MKMFYCLFQVEKMKCKLSSKKKKIRIENNLVIKINYKNLSVEQKFWSILAFK